MRPFLAISVEQRVTDLLIVAPNLPILAVMTPVDMPMALPCLPMVAFFAGAAGLPTVRVSVPEPELTACAVHLREPSGQRASRRPRCQASEPGSLRRKVVVRGGRAHPAVLEALDVQITGINHRAVRRTAGFASGATADDVGRAEDLEGLTSSPS